jgi:peroxiredoxin
VDVALKRYPKGHLAAIRAYNSFVQAKGTAVQKLALYQQFITDFPEPAVDADIIYDYARSEVAYQYARENDAKSNQEWISQIKSVSYKGTVEMSDAQTFLNNKDTVTAERLYRNSVSDNEKSIGNTENPGSRGNYYYSVAALADVLYAEHQYKDALKYAAIAYKSDTTNANNIQSYALALSGNGKASEGLPLLADLVRKGKANPMIQSNFKAIYVQAKGSDKGFDEYYQKIVEERHQKIAASLADKSVHEPALPFTLKDIDGNTVSLADLKGKVVILDFWATWCVPCKNSFPAMQMAVNKYKNDPNVKFLFIDTWERTPDPAKDIKEFITEKRYTFHVLLDDKTTQVVQKFKISGIPAKFVIDGEGVIRYKLTGFEGDNDAAVDELSAMIEIAKKSS